MPPDNHRSSSTKPHGSVAGQPVDVTNGSWDPAEYLTVDPGRIPSHSDRGARGDYDVLRWKPVDHPRPRAGR